MDPNRELAARVEALIKARVAMRIILGLTVFFTITIFLLPVALVLFIIYLRQKKRFNTDPLSKELNSFIEKRRAYIADIVEIENSIAAWEDRKEELDFQLECLTENRGLPLFFADEAILCELQLISDSAPSGPIAKATAVFADNTSVQTVAAGTSTSTSYRHGSNFPSDRDYNRIEGSSSSTQNQLVEVRSGTASVQISGGAIIPGVILFDSASEAREFTNTFNSASRSTSEAKKNLKANIEVCKDMIEEHELIGQGDFGAKELEHLLNGYPDAAKAWIIETADSMRVNLGLRQAMNSLPGQAGILSALLPNQGEKLVLGIMESAIKKSKNKS